MTDENLVREEPHRLGGTMRIYRFPDGHGLSMISSPQAHDFPFAWEAAVLWRVKKDGGGGRIQYTTPLTRSVEVFYSDDEANEFIDRARKMFVRKH